MDQIKNIAIMLALRSLVENADGDEQLAKIIAENEEVGAKFEKLVIDGCLQTYTHGDFLNGIIEYIKQVVSDNEGK